MKIDSSLPSSATAPKVRGQKANNAEAAPSSDASAVPHLQQAAPMDAAAAPFDNQRVGEIRDAIAGGRFQIDADKIAGRLIDGVRDMLAKNRSAA